MIRNCMNLRVVGEGNTNNGCKISGMNLKLYNTMGVLVLAKMNFETGSTIDINELLDGLYVYSLSSPSGISSNGKLIIKNSQ